MRKALLALCATLLLTACAGYSPLYKSLEGDGLADVYVRHIAMQQVKRAAGERRVAQLMTQRLMRRFSGGPEAPYALEISVEEVLSTIAVRRDATDQRYNLQLNGRVYLFKDGEKVLDEILSTSAAYNVEDSPYSTESGRDRARQSASNTLSDEVLLRVSRYLADPR
ncbi:MAG: hypothetical protein GC134_07420 [Proteobacteria bacterium]|nr:hypothetical protein [Pseudomonadota bacterium]